MSLTLVALVYDAVFNPARTVGRQLDLRSTYLSVVLLLVQAPSVRSIDSEIPRVTRLGANILMFWQTDVTSGSIQQYSKPLQGRLERQAERCDPLLIHGPRQRKIVCAGVLAFEAVGRSTCGAYQIDEQAGTRHARMLQAALGLSLQAWSRMQHALDPMETITVMRSKIEYCKCRRSKQ